MLQIALPAPDIDLRYCIADSEDRIYFQPFYSESNAIKLLTFDFKDNSFESLLTSEENRHLNSSFPVNLNSQNKIVWLDGAFFTVLDNGLKPIRDNPHPIARYETINWFEEGYLKQALGSKLSEFPMGAVRAIGFANNKMFTRSETWNETFVIDEDNKIFLVLPLEGREDRFHEKLRLGNAKMRFHKKYEVFINGMDGRLNWFDPEVGCYQFLNEQKNKDFTIGQDGHLYTISEQGLGRIKLSADMFKKKN